MGAGRTIRNDRPGELPTTTDGLLRLDPGCGLRLALSFSPETDAEAWGALAVVSVGEPDTPSWLTPAYVRDPRNFRQFVRLRGGDPNTPAPPEPGYLDAEPDACEPGETVELEAVVFGDHTGFGFAWRDELGSSSTLPTENTPNVSWTCPQLPDGAGGVPHTISVNVTDQAGYSEWAFQDISVYPESAGLDVPYVETVNSPGCTSAGGAGCGGLIGLFGVLVRRRSGLDGTPRRI